MEAYMVSDGGIGAPLEELLDDGLLVQRGGDVQGSVAVLKWRTVFRGPFFGREVEHIKRSGSSSSKFY